MSSDVTIVRAINTCNAVPSQWDAWDSENRYWYLRYRFGHGTAEHFPEGPTWYMKQQPGDPLPVPKERHYFTYGDDLDGYIELPEFCHQIGFKLVLGGWAPTHHVEGMEEPEGPVDHGLTIMGHSSLDEMWGELEEKGNEPRHQKLPKKRRWLALLLSALVPGLGSVYARSYNKAIEHCIICNFALFSALMTGSHLAFGVFGILWFKSILQADEDMFYYTHGYRDVRSYTRGYGQGVLGRFVIDEYERKGNNGNPRD